MHFLCLHGVGTNSKVLETQISAICYELDQYHTFDFVDGTIPCGISEDIKSFYPHNDTYFAYFEISPTSISKALLQLSAFIQEEGPFDGIIAFSHGAILAATYLLQLSLEPSALLPIKCGIFFSAGMALDPLALAKGLLEPTDNRGMEGILKLPTAHIWASDDVAFREHSLALSRLCERTQRQIFIHQEGHSIPTGRAEDAIQGCVRVIHRTIEAALANA